MQIISKSKSFNFSLFIFVSAIASLYLTFLWQKAISDETFIFPNKITFLYYLFNTCLLFISAYFLTNKKFKIYSIVSFVLGLSVTSSLFITTSGLGFDIRNLFFSTVFFGMTGGALHGATLFIPLFLSSVYISFFRSILFFLKKLKYSSGSEDKVLTSKNYILQKNIFDKMIPVLITVSHFFNIRQSFGFLRIWFDIRHDSFLTFMRDFFVGGLPVLVLVFAILSLLLKNKRAYRIINFILILMFLFPFVVFWIFPFFE